MRFFLLTLLIFFTAFSEPVLAADATAIGAPCNTEGLVLTTGGPERVPAVKLVCDGTTWQPGHVQMSDGTSLFQVGEDPGACSADKTGRLRYTSSSDEWEYCTGSAWRPFRQAGGDGSGALACQSTAKNFAGDGGPRDFPVIHPGVCTAKGHVFTISFNDGERVRAYRFDGTNWTLRNTRVIPARGTSINCDEDTVYVTTGASGIHAYTYDPGSDTWSAPITYVTPGSASSSWTDGTYVFVADSSTGIIALQFDGTAWTHVATHTRTGGAEGVWGDGTYIYAADPWSGLYALSFNGTAFSPLASVSSWSGVFSIDGADGYIFMADGDNGLRVLTFNGTAFTQVAHNTMDVAQEVWVDDGFIYIAGNTVVRVVTFDGTSFHHVTYLPGRNGFTPSVRGDGDYVYVLDVFDGLVAYPQCKA